MEAACACSWCGEGPDDELGPVTTYADGDLYHAGCWTSYTSYLHRRTT